MKTAGIYLDYDSFYIKLKKHAKQYPALGMDACVQWKYIKAGFLNLCMTDVWGWIILRDEGTVSHNAGILSVSLYPQGGISTPHLFCDG